MSLSEADTRAKLIDAAKAQVDFWANLGEEEQQWIRFSQAIIYRRPDMMPELKKEGGQKKQDSKSSKK